MYYKTIRKLLFVILLTVIACEAKSAEEKSVYFFDTSLHINTNVSFDKVRVVDNRINKENIGYFIIEGGFSKRKTKQIVTREPFNAEFEKYILNIVSPASKQPGELLLVFYDFMAEDKPDDLHMASLFIKADIFLGDNGSYQFIRSVDSFYEIIADNTTPILWKSIGEKTYNIISALASFAPGNSDDQATYTLASACRRIADIKRTIPVYNKPFSEGLYQTRQQFIDAIPVPTPFILKNVKVTESLTQTFLYTKKDNGRKGEKLDPGDYYAAYDKENGWFIKYKQTLSSTVFENNDFYVYVNGKGYYKSDGYGLALFGWAGILVSLAPDTYKVDATYKARLDPETGKLIPVKRIK